MTVELFSHNLQERKVKKEGQEVRGTGKNEKEEKLQILSD